MSGTRRPHSYTRHEEVRHGRYWRSSPLEPGVLLHRTSGPAIELADGTKEWWLEGECRAWQSGTALPPACSLTGCRSDIADFPRYCRIEP